MQVKDAQTGNRVYSKMELRQASMQESKNIVKGIEDLKKSEDLEKNKEKNNNDIDRAKINTAVDELNEIFDVLDRKITFKVFENKSENAISNRELYVVLIDKETQKVIKEIPPREVLEMRSRIREYVGMLIDEKV
ncbi:flagellar protein FlaG [Petroclostridium xylanilyticum]|uniref:flagellar protein FlaG n=1 Tax=Petroclostridium xylanilyticum TaxID=1792311 RepID=UPI000B97F651|nr:flagellar protein FlaG [Petroclostridium xylanilyticum]